MLDRRLIFVTGKGGVGKTTIASSLALLVAATGRRTLVVEMDGKGSVAAAFGVDPFAYAAAALPAPNLSGMAMSTEASLRGFLRRVVPVPFVGRLGPLARTFDFVADAAPGVREVLSVGKVLDDVRIDAWDTIIVDAEATGHVLAQIAAPTALREIIAVGAIRDQTEWMIDLLRDPSVTAVAVVATPEELAVNEALQLVDDLESQAGVGAVTVVANRVLPALLTRRQADTLRAIGERGDDLASIIGPGIGAVVEAAEIFEQRRDHGATQLGRISDRGIDMAVVGEFVEPGDGAALDLIGYVADSLAEEFDLDIVPSDTLSRRR